MIELCAAQILAGRAVTGSQASAYLNVYKVTSTGQTASLMYGPLIIPAGLFGFPGGNGAGTSWFHHRRPSIASVSDPICD